MNILILIITLSSQLNSQYSSVFSNDPRWDNKFTFTVGTSLYGNSDGAGGFVGGLYSLNRFFKVGLGFEYESRGVSYGIRGRAFIPTYEFGFGIEIGAMNGFHRRTGFLLPSNEHPSYAQPVFEAENALSLYAGIVLVYQHEDFLTFEMLIGGNHITTPDKMVCVKECDRLSVADHSIVDSVKLVFSLGFFF
ncbi:MAG: hypothetical protein JXR95_09880 [Deltaproteobacteria bacterium]|nr:hypothetical protein [Deltaproteobacteria bacterium]